MIGEPRQEIRRKVPDILRLVGLSTKLHNYPDELSGGEQQRVSIARAFVNHPPLLLADEPTGNLDPETSIGIMQLIYRINRTGTTVVVATHDNEMVDKMRRRVIELREGRIVRDERVRPLPPGRVDHASSPSACAASSASATRATRTSMRSSFFLREALRGLRRSSAPALAALAHRAAHRARARRLHPDRPGHDRHRERGAQPRGRRRLRQGRRDAAGHRPSCARALEAPPNVKSVEFISKAEALRDRAAEPEGPEGARAARLEPAAGHLPRHARGPGQARQDRVRARAEAPAASRTPSTARSTRCATARRTRTRSSRPPAS